ncbi:hypothetical protein RCL_jg18649.t1 [Rhizophagus clarus]|uniref:Uncharacterized protein n=1 Tax=Rhizophagus clarus TaxID=94130 RepID=A0A8H3QMN8_9GLOM|nr:hypothetical protein RCL_jg18649.t1 [Rhizophagus clarus]
MIFLRRYLSRAHGYTITARNLEYLKKQRFSYYIRCSHDILAFLAVIMMFKNEHKDKPLRRNDGSALNVQSQLLLRL